MFGGLFGSNNDNSLSKICQAFVQDFINFTVTLSMTFTRHWLYMLYSSRHGHWVCPHLKALGVMMVESVLYPIRAVSRLTGVSVHTLRAWERRYNVVTPIRDDRGRLYTTADIERLRLLNAAVQNGHPIGRLAFLPPNELSQVAADWQADKRRFSNPPSPPVSDSGSAPRSLIEAVLRLDHAAAERELALLAEVLSPRDLVHRIALPLLKEVGSLWEGGKASIAQEHLTSALLRNLIGGWISKYHRPTVGAKLLFSTPPGEQHEFGVLIAAMLATGGGLGIVYLGPNLPAQDIVSAASKTGSDVVVLGFVGSDTAGAGINDIEQVARELPEGTEIWVGGRMDDLMREKLRRTRVMLIEDFQSLERHLARLGAQF